MPWFNVDDGAHTHPKIIAARRSLALWVLAGSWSRNKLTDGFVPHHMIPTFGGTKAEIDRLVTAGLWEPTTQDGVSGWQFHDWADWNETRADVEKRQQQWRDRQAKARGQKPTNPVTHITEKRNR